MAKFHINQASGEVGMCRATKRCPFGDLQDDHYSSAAKAREAYEEQQATFSPNPALVPLKDTLVMAKPRVWASSASVETDYDAYGPDNYCTCPEDDYCRCSVYEGLRITSVDMDGTLSTFTGIPRDKLPESLREVGRKHSLDSEDGYELNVYGSYYGEEYDVELADAKGLQQDLDKWHARNCVDARDPAALYLVSKGHDPRKIDGVKLMKKHLKGHVSPSLLAKVKHMKSARLNYSDIIRPSPSFTSAPSAPAQLDVKSPARGVVVKTPAGYQLVEGAESYRKGAASSSATGIFIVLE